MPGRLGIANPIDLGGDAGADPFEKYKALQTQQRGEKLTEGQRKSLKKGLGGIEEPWNEDGLGTIYGLNSVDF